MAYDNDDRLGIPEFMQRTNTYGRDFESKNQRRQNSTRNVHSSNYDDVIDAARRRSLDQRRIQAKKKTKKVDKSFTGRLKKHWKGIVITMGLGATIFSGVQSLGEDYHELKMISQNPVATATREAIFDHQSRTDDNQHWQLDSFGVSMDVDRILENGGDPLTVLGTLSSNLNEAYTQDELATVVEHSFGEDPDTLVRSLNPERYEEGIQDPDFKEDVRNYIVEQEEARVAGFGLADMLSARVNVPNTSEKGMGGK